MEVLRVDVEVEAETMTAVTHVATEIAQMRQVVETVTFTEEAVVYAHVLEAQEIITALEEIDVTAKTQNKSQEKTAATEMKFVDQVEVQSERVLLH